ncbi:netrin receptor UNC5C isoform X1 [Strongylocentrotus purpuratus]|uniref:Netrin receptor UNC5 n=1 Tax=Strongylocentrotus purpuratus TaxID=7668 RepID=A0A7M7NEF6_STRPU|nr:netrin receptor UNC5C isoform X1 [Strongylocentrotus purpuratus]
MTPLPPTQFFIVPQDSYITKRSVDLECKAGPSPNVYFICNDEKIADGRTHSIGTFDEYYEDIRHIALSITKDEVQEYFGDEDFWCVCEAAAEPQPIRTEKAYIREAYLRKQFLQMPLDHSVPLHDKFHLLCRAPEGVPEPTIHWEMDGVPIDDENLVHYVVTYDGTLIVNEATLADNGNYTCVATNVATYRTTDPARVIVYDNTNDGAWTIWTEWSTCTGDCDGGTRRRMRYCTNPAPVIDGANCVGKAVQTEDCSIDCPAAAIGWSEWSMWSRCTDECVQIRTRTCTRQCSGEPQQRRNCSGGLCLSEPPLVVDDPGIFSPSAGDTTSQNPAAGGKNGLSKQIPVYIGISLAIVVLLLVFLFIAIYLVTKRKRGNSPSYTTTSTEDCNLAMLSAQPPDITTQTMHSSLRSNHVALSSHNEKIPMSGTPTHPPHPDLTGGKIPHQLTVQFSPKKGGTITQLGCLGSSDISQYSLNNGSLHSHPHSRSLSPTKSHTYVPLVGPGQEKHIYATLNPPEPPPQDPRYCQTRCYGDLEDNDGYIMEEADENYMLQGHSSEESLEPQSMCDSDPGRTLSGSALGLPMHSDYSIATGHVGSRGGRLVLPDSGVSLMIPEGAIARGQTVEIYLAVSHELMDRPHIEHNQTLLSPVILCGPPSVVLAKSVVLVLPHCAQMSKNDWRHSVIASSTHPTDDKCWEKQTTVGEETINLQVFCQVDSHLSCIVTDQLGWYALSGESRPERQSAKRLKLLAFGPALRSTLDYHIKVYISEDTPDAIEHILNVERRLGGQPLQGGCQFDYHDNGNNLRLEIQNIVPGWQCKLAKNCQEIPFYHVWSGTSNTLHCSFALVKTEPGIGPIGCRLEVTQGTYTTSMQVMERIIDGVVVEQELRLNGYSPNHMVPPQNAFHLSKPVRTALCQCLDIPNSFLYILYPSLSLSLGGCGAGVETERLQPEPHGTASERLPPVKTSQNHRVPMP